MRRRVKTYHNREREREKKSPSYVLEIISLVQYDSTGPVLLKKKRVQFYMNCTYRTTKKSVNTYLYNLYGNIPRTKGTIEFENVCPKERE